MDWYPWGEEAISAAREQGKPIFLSVGYSTCHWCHVMERESFESEAVAAFLGEHFVSVKVDREERPDVDRLYMAYVQATTGAGGWPMTVFLTPELEPFLGGTYFPPEDRPGRPGFLGLLRKVQSVWAEREEEVRGGARDALATLAELSSRSLGEAPGEGPAPGEAAGLLSSLCRAQGQRFDAANGGFGDAPKFPRPAEVLALLEASRRGLPDGTYRLPAPPLRMALASLVAMSDGGMYDHVGGGFHRYSVDALFHVPHFEKMLYDNPQLVLALLAGVSLDGGADAAAAGVLTHAARGTLDYMLRDLRHPGGGFFSAEDADSADPGTGEKAEGRFYTFTQAEFRAAVEAGGGGAEAARLAAAAAEALGVEAPGNCRRDPRSDPAGEFAGTNVLYRARASRADVAEADVAEARRRLHAARSARPRPHLDDKVVAAWNGMAVSALARASGVLGPAPASFPAAACDPGAYLAAAGRAAEFVRSHLWDEAGHGIRLARSYRESRSGPAFADDYAWMVAGLLDLYEAGAELRWLRWALELQDEMDEAFWDAGEGGGGYFQSREGDALVRFRAREDYDGAEPAASSVAALNLARLGALCPGLGAYGERARACVRGFLPVLRRNPLAMPLMCKAAAVVAGAGEMQQVILARRAGAGGPGPGEGEGEGEGGAWRGLLREVLADYDTGSSRAIVHVSLGEEGSEAFWEAANPSALAVARAGAAGARGTGGATAHLCQDFTCHEPTSDPARLRELVREAREAGRKASGAQAFDLSALLGGGEG